MFDIISVLLRITGILYKNVKKLPKEQIMNKSKTKDRTFCKLFFRKIIIPSFLIFSLFSCNDKNRMQDPDIQKKQFPAEWLSEYHELQIEKQENLLKNPFKKIKFYVTTDEGNQIRKRLPEKYRRKSIYAGVSLNYKKVEALIDSVNAGSTQVIECVVRIHNATMRLPISEKLLNSKKTEHTRIGEVTEVPEKVIVVLSFFNIKEEELIVFSGKFNSKGKNEPYSENFDLKLNDIINIDKGIILQVEDNSNKESKIDFHYEVYRHSKNRDKTELFTSGYSTFQSSKYENYIPIHLDKNLLPNDLVIVGIDSLFSDGISQKDINMDNNIFSRKLNRLEIEIAGDYFIEPTSVMMTNNSVFANNVFSFGLNYRGEMFHEFVEEDIMAINLEKYERSQIVANPVTYTFYIPDIIPGKYLLIINPNRKKPEKITKNNYFTFTIPQ